MFCYTLPYQCNESIMATDDKYKRNQFKELFEENYSKLYYVAVSIVGDEEDAHDIVSDFFACLWEHYGEDTQQKYNHTYLYRGVQRRCLDFIKHSKVKDKFNQHYLTENPIMFFDDETEDERLRKIEQVIDQMPERTKFVVDKCYMEGKKYVEVAEMLSISRDGVRKHITKALGMLRSAFAVEKKK